MYLQQYAEAIRTGEIVAGRKVRKMYARLIRDLDDPNKPFYFDEEKAKRPVAFIELFVRFATEFETVKLELFQKAMIEAIFGFVWRENGYRKFREVLVELARKNGKTAIAAGISWYMLVADKEPAAECYSVATKLDQAKKTFDEIVAIREYSPDLKLVSKKRRTDVYIPSTLSYFKPLASEHKSLDGFNGHYIVMDEVQAMENRYIYELMLQSFGAKSRKQPLLFMITTAGFIRESLFDDRYRYANDVIDEVVDDETFLPLIYELDDPQEWLDPDCWVKPNPGLGPIKSLEYLIDMVERAKNDPVMKNTVLVKDFNVIGVSGMAWLPADIIINPARFDISEVYDTYAMGGVDLSSTTDLTCATLMIVKKGVHYVLQRYFIPEDVLDKKIREDKVPYDLWKDWITLCPGSRVDYSMITQWFIEMRETHKIDPLRIGYDSWNANYWVKEMQAEGFKMEEVIQGAKTMSAPMKIMAADLAEKRINYNDNPVLRWNLFNLAIKSDDNENIRPVSIKPTMRKDGAVSLIDAYVVYTRNKELYHTWQE